MAYRGYFILFLTFSLPTGEVATVYPNNPTNSVSWGSPFPEYPFWIGSVAEAIFLIGEERNSPRIIGASYVCLLPHSLDATVSLTVSLI